MEMQEVQPKTSDEDEGAGAALVEVKSQKEAEPDEYDQLQSPSEDVYSETFFNNPPVPTKEAKQTKGNERLFRYGCLFLTVLCFILLLVIIILSMKLQSGFPSSCTIQKCPQFRAEQLHGQQCAKGWILFGKSCFFLSTVRLTWAESQKNCSSSGGSLAVISTQSLQSFLTYNGNLKYWIGLRQDNNAWNWVDNKQLEQSFWAKPPQDGDCAFLSSEDPAETNWGRASCKAATYFICQQQT